VIEQYRSQFNSSFNPLSAAYNHQSYRTEEYLRFRRPLRDAEKIIVRSRSEESACYQIYDKESLPEGIGEDEYINLPGHKIAFGNAPTHIIIVSAPLDWTKEEYQSLRKKRSGSRLNDDYEKKVDYMLLVNRRYTSDWIDNLYKKACKLHGSAPPKIIKIGMYDKDRKVRDQKTIRSIIWRHLLDMNDRIQN